jgi:hypothetical protein
VGIAEDDELEQFVNEQFLSCCCPVLGGPDVLQAEAGAAGREMQRKYYRPAAYAFTKLVLDGLLLRALPALLFTLPFYFLMGLNPAALQVSGR